MRDRLPFYVLISLLAGALALVAAGASLDSRASIRTGLVVAGVVATTLVVGIALRISFREIPAAVPQPLDAQSAAWLETNFDWVLERCKTIWANQAYTAELLELGWRPPSNLDEFCREAIWDFAARFGAAGSGSVTRNDGDLALDDDSAAAPTSRGDAASIAGSGSVTGDVNEDDVPPQTPNEGDRPRRGQRDGPVSRACECRWEVTFDTNPKWETDKYPPPNSDEATGMGESKVVGPLHNFADSWGNNCWGSDGRTSSHPGWALLISRVVCTPDGCCKPEGRTLVMSAYSSDIKANSDSGFCFFQSCTGTAVAADACQLTVDGAIIPAGSDSKAVTSGALSTAALNLTFTTGLTLGGPKGTGSIGPGIQVGVTKAKADGEVDDVLTKEGMTIVERPGVISELQTTGKTVANVAHKAAALAQVRSHFYALAHIAVEKKCGAGRLEYARFDWVSATVYPEVVSFNKKYDLIRSTWEK